MYAMSRAINNVDAPGSFLFRIIYNAAIAKPLPNRFSAVQECDATKVSFMQHCLVKKATMFKNANKIVVL